MDVPRPTNVQAKDLGLGEVLITEADLAEFLRTSLRTVKRMRSAGQIPEPDLRAGKSPRWKRSTIQAWLDGGDP